MLPLVQHALRRAGSSDVGVPPVSRLERAASDGAGVGGAWQHHHDDGADPGATEFLSRLLLLLGSFVIFCLLLF